ncbi:hypothetical protein OG568_50440 (plasmid) [Streptomyces sp. NBC_01450]|uniref:hypothetical protein n=1 Tax=Streptomyces sp. NBC_01450 TaxID=2903871 RepID=UPI002E35837D|nr:hypothetical protein [Streptomyces sp. NBC_01450]
MGLGDGLLAEVAVLFGLGAGGGVCGGLGHVAVGEVDVAEDTVAAARPAEGFGGGECGGELAGRSREVGQGAGGVWGVPAAAGGDLLHAVAGGGRLAEVAVCFGSACFR